MRHILKGYLQDFVCVCVVCVCGRGGGVKEYSIYNNFGYEAVNL